jgi:hypothetical protein
LAQELTTVLVLDVMHTPTLDRHGRRDHYLTGNRDAYGDSTVRSASGIGRLVQSSVDTTT